jgi:hypothetical protein
MSRFWIAVLSLTCSTPGWACSPDGEYRAPTNVELIERADLVVLGRVDAGRPKEQPSSNAVGLTPIRTLKGRAPEKLTLYGTFRDRYGKPVAPQPTKLNELHSSSLWGSCDRQGYAPGTLVIATFKKRPGGYMQMTYPFARNVEDVEDQQGLWVQAATLYARIISQNPPAQRRKAFQKERERLLAQSRDSDAQAIAQDIATYLRATARR